MEFFSATRHQITQIAFHRETENVAVGSIHSILIGKFTISFK